jgi:arylsulfatase A-like enzyme
MYLPLSFLIVALLVVLRSAPQMSPEAAAYVAGFVTAVACVAVSVDALARTLARAHARALGPTQIWWAIGLLNFGAAAALGGYRALGEAEPLFGVVGILVALAAAGGALTFVASKKAAVKAPYLVLAWSALSLGMFVTVHTQTGTLVAVREGTERLHLLLFVVTWLGGFVLPLGAYFRESESSTKKTLRTSVGVALLLFGASALEADRRAFVDLYSAVHVWLGAAGIFAGGQGIALLLEAHVPKRPLVRLGGRISLGILCLAALTLALLGPKFAQGVVRSKIAREPLGMSLLEFLPNPDDGKATFTDHPALSYEQHLTAPPLKTRPNILLVTVDALRADALERMPKLGKRLSSCAVFERTYAQGTRTAIGMGTLMTGRYSAEMDWDLWSYSGGKVSQFSALSAKERLALGKRLTFTTVPRVAEGNMLAERLRSVGYDTSAVPFAGKNEFFRSDLVFARGFHHFVDLTEEEWKPPTSKRVLKRSLEQLRKAKDPWFHWVHLYDPHEAKGNKSRYQKYVRAVDDALASALKKLEDQQSETALVLLADHGEAFGEHRHQGHATSLYDEQALVPFVLCLPRSLGQRFAEPVAAIDATATLVAMTGAPTEALDGVNLLPLLQGQAGPPKRPIFLELHRYMSSKGRATTDLKGVVFEEHKLILNRKNGTEEFYDLSADPKEANNLAGEGSEVQSRLRAILHSFLARAEARHPLPDVSKLIAE